MRVELRARAYKTSFGNSRPRMRFYDRSFVMDRQHSDSGESKVKARETSFISSKQASS